MKSINYLLLLFSLFLSFRAFACENEYEAMTSPDGAKVKIYDNEGTSAAMFTHGFDTTYLLKQKAVLLQRLAQDSAYQDLSDLALIELRIGDRYKAVRILEKLHNQHPHEYNLMANLGTAYELVGHNELAYRFIKKAMEINPRSHQGSEWIHLSILEQKLKDMPDWAMIMNLGIGKDLTHHYKSLKEEQLSIFINLKKALTYQLRERIAFIGPEDALVAQLLLDLGDLVAMTESLELAHPLYELAARYGERTPLLDIRLQEIQKVPYQNPLENYWYWALLGLVLTALIYYIFMTRFRRVRVSNEGEANKTAA